MLSYAPFVQPNQLCLPSFFLPYFFLGFVFFFEGIVVSFQKSRTRGELRILTSSHQNCQRYTFVNFHLPLRNTSPLKTAR